MGREHPLFNPVTVAFLSKPNPSTMNGALAGCGHFDPVYGYSPGYIAAAPSCYHDYVDHYAMCNGTAPPHPMAPSAPMRGHLQQATASGLLGMLSDLSH